MKTLGLALLLALAFAVPARAATAAAPACTAVMTPFTGSICVPQTAGKHPAIVLLGGSEGGDATADKLAVHFAQLGYVAAGVGYFGLPGLPQTLEEVPIEPVGLALDVLAKRADVDPNRIAIFGASKGGELALLAASVYPQIHAVIADVPSPFAWQGIPRGPAAPKSSWTYHGVPLPYVAYTAAMGTAYMNAFVKHAPLDIRGGYEDAMNVNASQIPAAMFHLENIHGPVLMLAAGDDQIWDSVRQSDLAMQYLKAHHHAFADRVVVYPKAGHMFLFSTSAMPFTSMNVGGGLTMEFGGTTAANVAAGQAGWTQIDAFLSKALAS